MGSSFQLFSRAFGFRVTTLLIEGRDVWATSRLNPAMSTEDRFQFNTLLFEGLVSQIVFSAMVYFSSLSVGERDATGQGTLTLMTSLSYTGSGVLETFCFYCYGDVSSFLSLNFTPSISFIANLVFSCSVIPLSLLIAVAYSLNRFILCIAAVLRSAIFSLTSSSTTSMTLFAICYFLSSAVCSVCITCAFVEINFFTDLLSLEKSGVLRVSLSIQYQVIGCCIISLFLACSSIFDYSLVRPKVLSFFFLLAKVLTDFIN